MFKRRDVLVLGSGWLAGMGMIPPCAVAQSKYPERPIRLVVASVPGGVADAVGRRWAEAMKALLGPVFIENQAGGGGSIGAATVDRAKPDGYCVLLGGVAILVLIPAASHARWEFAPISILGVVPIAFIVHPSLPARNLKELVEYAKANPGELSYGSPGAGTMSHLAVELFKSLTGINGLVHVPYKGASQSISDLISGQIPIATLNFSDQVLQLHRSGKARMVAVMTPARLIAAPDIPTAVEQGLPGMMAENFFGLFAPIGTSTEIIEQIADATHRAMADNGFRERLIASGFEPYLDSSPAAARHFVEREIDRWRPVIKAIGLKLGTRRGSSERA